jgi:hypothetical protein
MLGLNGVYVFGLDAAASIEAHRVAATAPAGLARVS